jgi:thermolysin
VRQRGLALAALLVIASPGISDAQPAPPRAIAAQTGAALRTWDTAVDQMNRDGTLRRRSRRDDPLMSSRTHERYDQFHDGVRVFGGDLTRQLAGGLTTSIFGGIYENVDLQTVSPAITAAAARAAIERAAGIELLADYEPELVILPLAGRFALAYMGRGFSSEGLYRYFVDAGTGGILLTLNELKSQAAIGSGRGVLNDRKKVSTNRVSGTFRTQDLKRPPSLVTYDLRGNLIRTLGFLNGVIILNDTDIAGDTDNAWSDPAVVDAHAYSGYVYDYLYKRFGRRGLDGADMQVRAIVHPVDRSAIATQPNAVIQLFYLNAFYAGNGIMVFGEGLPPGLVDPLSRSWNYLAGALDVFAHELGHGVTDFSSQLVYHGESGALNEGFSDVLAVGAEFFYQPPGNAPLRAEYLIGEDVVSGGLRSLSNPLLFGDPDHYSIRYTGPDDNGGVHINATIVGHAFYLAVEGGRNRTSGITVVGVGGGNREQIERVFYRAFTQMMPANATFAVARQVTTQAAVDLYGAGSAVVRAIGDAWTAVGVS